MRRLLARRLALDDLWLLFPPTLLFVWLGVGTIHPADFWWHLRTGQIIVETGRVPGEDLLTFTRAGQPWINQAWLSQVVLYLLYRAGGLPLILLVFRIALSAGYALVESACLQDERIGARSAALAAIGAMLLGHLNWGVRPQAASYLCFGLLVYVLEKHRTRGGSLLWVLPLLFALWANLHGGFVFGLALLAVCAVSGVVRDLVAARSVRPETSRLLLVLGLSVVALGLNPAGPVGMARYLLGFARSETTLVRNLEFLPLSLRERDGLLFFTVMAGFAALVAWRRVSLPTYLVGALVVFGFLSLYTRRVLPWFGMAAAPAFALTLARPRLAQATAPRRRPGRPMLNYFAVFVLLLAVIASLPWVRSRLPRFRDGFSYVDLRWTPVEASRVLCGLGAGTRVFNDITYGSYLSWACPAIPVFMDTRFELYPVEMWSEYLLVTNGQYGWEQVLDKYQIGAILADREVEKVLISAAEASGRWRTAYQDDHAVVLLRTAPQ